MKLSVNGRVIREFEIELAEKEPQFWVFVDLEGSRGKIVRIEVNTPGAESRRTGRDRPGR